MTSLTFFIVFIPILAVILLAVNLIFAPHLPYDEKNSTFECGFHSFLGQNRTEFNISFFIFALLFLLFDLEILLIYPYSVSQYTNELYGLIVMLIFFGLLTIGFAFEFGKKALKIDSKQNFEKNYTSDKHIILMSSVIDPIILKFIIDYISLFFKILFRYISLFFKIIFRYISSIYKIIFRFISSIYKIIFCYISSIYKIIFCFISSIYRIIFRFISSIYKIIFRYISSFFKIIFNFINFHLKAKNKNKNYINPLFILIISRFLNFYLNNKNLEDKLRSDIISNLNKNSHKKEISFITTLLFFLFLIFYILFSSIAFFFFNTSAFLGLNILFLITSYKKIDSYINPKVQLIDLVVELISICFIKNYNLFSYIKFELLQCAHNILVYIKEDKLKILIFIISILFFTFILKIVFNFDNNTFFSTIEYSLSTYIFIHIYICGLIKLVLKKKISLENIILSISLNKFIIYTFFLYIGGFGSLFTYILLHLSTILEYINVIGCLSEILFYTVAGLNNIFHFHSITNKILKSFSTVHYTKFNHSFVLNQNRLHDKSFVSLIKKNLTYKINPFEPKGENIYKNVGGKLFSKIGITHSTVLSKLVKEKLMNCNVFLLNQTLYIPCNDFNAKHLTNHLNQFNIDFKWYNIKSNGNRSWNLFLIFPKNIFKFYESTPKYSYSHENISTSCKLISKDKNTLVSNMVINIKNNPKLKNIEQTNVMLINKNMHSNLLCKQSNVLCEKSNNLLSNDKLSNGKLVNDKLINKSSTFSISDINSHTIPGVNWHTFTPGIEYLSNLTIYMFRNVNTINPVENIIINRTTSMINIIEGLFNLIESNFTHLENLDNNYLLSVRNTNINFNHYYYPDPRAIRLFYSHDVERSALVLYMGPINGEWESMRVWIPISPVPSIMDVHYYALPNTELRNAANNILVRNIQVLGFADYMYRMTRVISYIKVNIYTLRNILKELEELDPQNLEILYIKDKLDQVVDRFEISTQFIKDAVTNEYNGPGPVIGRDFCYESFRH